MPRQPNLPRVSRVDFYRLHEDDLIFSLAQAIEHHARKKPAGKLIRGHEALFAWCRLAVDVPNGGFTQFFFNHRGDVGVMAAADLLDELAVSKAGPLLREAVAIYRQHKSKFKVANPWDGLFGSIGEFEKLDPAFEGVALRSTRALEKWIRANIAELAIGDDGAAIDPKFTGSVETRQPKGEVGEYLEVKNGKPNGAYREFFEDGTIRKVIFYKAGEVSGDFWPSGQLKKKESKRGPHKVIEWFYPSGKLQKRLVKDRSGYPVEPVRLFHENGQLAEELTFMKGEERGPWLKYFDDGSPQLEAKYARGEKLIVHNAWDENRRQVVKNGTGTFHDDGRSIDPDYALFFKSDWVRDIELRDGIRHGKQTTYHDGVLWSVCHYKNGVHDGKDTSYWDNGRVRSITTYTKGRAGKTQSFPKFDQPVPVVLLSVEANEELYTAWEHMPVDEYPRVLNLEKVRRQLKIPEFLRAVHERNLAHTLESDYEDANDFNDGIAYFLTVSETGAVASAAANGSGVHSGGEWNTYIPLLKKLRFTPGRIRGRAVECRVLAWVDHTFAEGPARPRRGAADDPRRGHPRQPPRRSQSGEA